MRYIRWRNYIEMLRREAEMEKRRVEARERKFNNEYSDSLSFIKRLTAGKGWPFPIVVRSFHPGEKFGKGHFLLAPVIGSDGKDFHGDNRGFALEDTDYSKGGYPTARISQKFTVDPNTKQVKLIETRSGVTVHPTLGEKTATPRGYVKNMQKGEKGVKFNVGYSGSNPLTRFKVDIDVEANFEVTKEAGNIVKIQGALYGDDFPNTEAIIADKSGKKLLSLQM